MSKLRPAYLATLKVLVVAESSASACDGISSMMQAAEERLGGGFVVDWSYVEIPDARKDVFGLPEGWEKVLISSASDYEEGEFFNVPDRSVKFHKDWYHDGIDGKEDLWRNDPEADIQVQLFAKVEDPDAEIPVYTGKWRLFIEHDVRDAVGSVNRVKYSAKEFEADVTKAKRLLEMNEAQVQDFLAVEIAKVKALPDDPEYH